MIHFHKIREADINLEEAILRHSADESVIYKYVNGEPVYIGYYFPLSYDRTMKHPVFIFIHGGGWESHKIFEDQSHWQGDYLGYLARYYADRGYLSVSIDYRLIGERGKLPGYEVLDCYEDCCDALDYVIQHSDEYGIDTQAIYLLGESAGGHLAGALVTFHYDRRYFFKRTFLINAITHFRDAWKVRVPMKSRHSRLEGLSFTECADFLSPLCQISGNIGDIVMIHGEDDKTVSPEHSRLFYNRMVQAGRKCELHMLEKTGHAFLLAEYYQGGLEACKTAIRIINRNVL